MEGEETMKGRGNEGVRKLYGMKGGKGRGQMRQDSKEKGNGRQEEKGRKEERKK